MLSRLRRRRGKRMGWSCCPRGGRSGVGAREASTLNVPLWKCIMTSVWLFCFFISLKMCMQDPSPPSTICFSFGPCIIQDPCWKRSLKAVLKKKKKAVLNKQGFPGSSSVKESACQCRRCKRFRFDPGLGRSPGEGHGNPPQYSHLENPMDRGARRAAVVGVMESRTRLSDCCFHCHLNKQNTLPGCLMSVCLWHCSYVFSLIIWHWFRSCHLRQIIFC